MMKITQLEVWELSAEKKKKKSHINLKRRRKCFLFVELTHKNPVENIILNSLGFVLCVMSYTSPI